MLRKAVDGTLLGASNLDIEGATQLILEEANIPDERMEEDGLDELLDDKLFTEMERRNLEQEVEFPRDDRGGKRRIFRAGDQRRGENK